MATEKMPFVWVALLVLLVASLSVQGCGTDTPGEGKAEEHAKLIAKSVRDGARPFAEYQSECPVCGKPIDPDVHTKSEKKRIYFDKQECLEKFQQNAKKYRKKLRKKLMLPSGGSKKSP